MSPERREFDLGDYVQVKDRIAKFYELYGNGRLVTGEVRVSREPDDKPRVWVEAFAYRNPDDTLPGHGWSWMELPGTSSFTRGSELENTETSAWGRAIASLGILTDHSIASAQEVRDKSQPAPANDGDAPEPIPPTPAKYEETEELLGRITKAGTVKRGTASTYKLEARQTPDGYAVGFRLEVDGDRAIPQVLCEGEVGHALVLAYDDVAELLGRRVTVKGRLYGVKAPGRSTYTRLRVQEIQTPDMAYPAAEVPGQEPLFSEAEEKAIAEAVDKAPTGTAA
jgi:hypothetical protein